MIQDSGTGLDTTRTEELLESQREDTARLDWLERLWVADNGAAADAVGAALDSGVTLRQAIDAARKVWP